MNGQNRQLITNWNKRHSDLAKLIEEQGKKFEPKEDNLHLLGDNGSGWSYVTFFSAGTPKEKALFNVAELERVLSENRQYVPRQLVDEHSKVVVEAFSENPSLNLFALYKVLETYASFFRSATKFPNSGFYGKFGGRFERPEKGRALALYSVSDENILTIHNSVMQIMPKVNIPNVDFSIRFSNGLTELTRQLEGFDNPEYKSSGATHYRVTNPQLFAKLVKQAQEDHSKYLFEKDD